MHLGKYRSDLEIVSSSKFTQDLPKSQVILDSERYIYLKDNGTVMPSFMAMSIPGTLTGAKETTHVENVSTFLARHHAFFTSMLQKAM